MGAGWDNSPTRKVHEHHRCLGASADSNSCQPSGPGCWGPVLGLIRPSRCRWLEALSINCRLSRNRKTWRHLNKRLWTPDGPTMCPEVEPGLDSQCRQIAFSS